jgi:hypothetical protein
MYLISFSFSKNYFIARQQNITQQEFPPRERCQGAEIVFSMTSLDIKSLPY